MRRIDAKIAGRRDAEIRPRLRGRLSAIITLGAQIMRDSRFTAYVYGAIYTVERKCGGFNGFEISYTPLDGCVHVRGLVACCAMSLTNFRIVCAAKPRASSRG